MAVPVHRRETTMRKYGDIVALLEWAMKTKNPKTPKGFRPSRKKAELNLDDLDLAEVYLKLEAREKRIKASKEAVEKLMKKDDKKPNNDFLSMPRLAMLLVASSPITAPLYVIWLFNMLKTMGMH